jgi:hypothetical protein
MTMTQNQIRQALKSTYLIDFPDDLFAFWDFAKSCGADKPLLTFAEATGIALEGPFAILAGEADAPPNGWHLGTRYYDDPPEFFLVLSGDTDGLHWGYWFDDPDNSPTRSVAQYFSRDAFDLMEDGDSLFEAFRLQLEGCQMTTLEYLETDPDTEQARASYEARLETYTLYRSRVVQYATGDRPETGEEYYDKYAGISPRSVTADTFEGMGIVVPEALYRPLSLGDEELRARAIAGADLSDVVAEAQRALAEGFPGTALKLGRDLWIGNAGQKQDAYRLLGAAYEALNRPTLQTLLSRIASAREE